MIKVIPRHAFSASQGAVFPVLFQFGDICTALALATFCMLHPPTTLTSTAEIVQVRNARDTTYYTLAKNRGLLHTLLRCILVHAIKFECKVTFLGTGMPFYLKKTAGCHL